MSKTKSPDGPESASRFEDDLTRLETIIRNMESGDASLDDMIALFEEGSGLIKRCATKLNEVEKKIEVLVQKDGKYATEPFPPESSPRPSD